MVNVVMVDLLVINKSSLQERKANAILQNSLPHLVPCQLIFHKGDLGILSYYKRLVLKKNKQAKKSPPPQ